MSFPSAPKPPAQALRISSLIRDNMNALPQHHIRQHGPLGTHVPKPPPTQSQHSVAWPHVPQISQILNPQQASSNAKPVDAFREPPVTGNPRHGRKGFGLDLHALLANIGEADTARNVPVGTGVATARAARTLSGRPRPPVSARVGGDNAPVAVLSPLHPTQQKPSDNMQLPKPTQEETRITVTATTVNLEADGPGFAPPPTRAHDVTLGLGRPISPAQALTTYDKFLTKYEKKEVLEYEEIYFIGSAASKVEAPLPNSPNFGYDDENGDYVAMRNDHVKYRYELMACLGKGSFGQVYRARDYKMSMDVAIKIIRNKKRFQHQATVEVRVLKHLRTHDPEDQMCCVRMLDDFTFRGHVVIVCELYGMNLYELTKANRYQPFSPPVMKRFTAQLLVAMNYMWKERLVHCDIKPENVLLRQDNKTGIRLIDFGSSCFEHERIYTYIQSRFYRAPEIILGLPYGRPIDLWSLACVICEMACGYPIFPGEDEVQQLLCIMEVFGPPPQKLIERSPRKKHFFDGDNNPRVVPNSRNKLRNPSSKSLRSLLPPCDDQLIDFLMLFFRWEPSERATPFEAMHHPWISSNFCQETAEVPLPSQRPSTRLPTAPPRQNVASGGLPQIASTTAKPFKKIKKMKALDGGAPPAFPTDMLFL